MAWWMSLMPVGDHFSVEELEYLLWGWLATKLGSMDSIDILITNVCSSPANLRAFPSAWSDLYCLLRSGNRGGWEFR